MATAGVLSEEATATARQFSDEELRTIVEEAARSMVEAGMTPIGAAGLLGVEDLGALEPGLLADVVAVPGDPLEDVSVLEEVSFVKLGGEVYRIGSHRGGPDGVPLEVSKMAKMAAR